VLNVSISRVYKEVQSALLLKYLSEMNSTKDILRLPLERYNESICVYTSSYINISKGYTILQIYISRAYVGYLTDIIISQQDILTKSLRFFSGCVDNLAILAKK